MLIIFKMKNGNPLRIPVQSYLTRGGLRSLVRPHVVQLS